MTPYKNNIHKNSILRSILKSDGENKHFDRSKRRSNWIFVTTYNFYIYFTCISMKDFQPTLPIGFDVVVRRRVRLHGIHHRVVHHVGHIHLEGILNGIDHRVRHRLVRRHHDDHYRRVRRRHDRQQVVGHSDRGRRLRHHDDRQIQQSLKCKLKMSF